VVSIKYALFIMKANDDGEGGVFAMLALLHKNLGPRLGRGLVFSGLFGSALLYGDGLITPVISVLSALEGLEMATTQAKPVVLPLTCLVLFLLFWAQSHGTGRIGKLFGPVMIIWFAVIAMLGIRAISGNPEILMAVNPQFALRFFLHNGLLGFSLLGAVVLCITGCEALYADMGHFGIKSIRLSWYLVALPALLCNYFGQGALILNDPKTAIDPFYNLVPGNLLYPMVALATTATIIASQAIISGVFSLTRQAIQLGFLPRLRIQHTSAMMKGQVYIPDVNIFMMLAAILLALYFKASENLANAYGIAVTADMFITTVVFFFRYPQDLGLEPGKGFTPVPSVLEYGFDLFQCLYRQICQWRVVPFKHSPIYHDHHGHLVGRLEGTGNKSPGNDRSHREVHGKGQN